MTVGVSDPNPADMRSLVAAIVGWSLFVAAVLYLAPGMPNALVACMRLVGRSEACVEQQEQANATVIALWTTPMLLFLVAGYVAIAVIAIRRSRAHDWQPAAGE